VGGTTPGIAIVHQAITQAEILYGLELLPKGKRRSTLQSAAEAMFAEEFVGRILPFDGDAALLFPQIACARRAVGRPVTQFDTQIAAIARARGGRCHPQYG
jgi:toxin FitB